MTDNHIPFFGIGAMRSGTTWLADLLESYSDCSLMPRKEMHFFDVKYGKTSGAEFYLRLLSQLGATTEKVTKRANTALKRMSRRRAADGAEWEEEEEQAANSGLVRWTDEIRGEFLDRARLDSENRVTSILDYFKIRDTDSYVAYVNRHGKGARAFGEITPAYALLPSQAFAEMVQLFPSAHFIFIMRDPVDRLWSQIRFRTENYLKNAGKMARDPVRSDPNRELRRSLSRTPTKSGYEHTITNLEAVVPEDRILYLFFENMISPESGPAEIRKVESHLGLEPVEPGEALFRRAVNSSAPARLDRKNEDVAMEMLKPTYEFIERRFGPVPGWRRP